jgi:hypothetical protein
MKGSLVIERVNDPQTRREWLTQLRRLRKAIDEIEKSNRIPVSADPTRMAYLEAVMEFTEARDAERNFFWDAFIDQRLATK